tara:strand:+ start:2004 stop:2354 length:351 start_codon:yes stop_codon:yes gene_type:complete
MEEKCDIIEIDAMEKRCTPGGEYLNDIKYERKFSEQQLMYWMAEIEKTNPKLEKGLIKQTLDMYSTNPEIFEEVMEEHKQFPERFEVNAEEPRMMNGMTLAEHNQFVMEQIQCANE